MSKLCRHTHFLIRLYRSSECNGTDTCSDMQKQACTDIAYTSSPISGTSSLTLCIMVDLESTKF